MADPTQKGTQLVFKAAPTFEDFIVVDGTWQETDPQEVEMTKDGNSETINLSGADPGVDAECELVIKATPGTPVAKFDQLTATYPGAVTKKFHVVDVTTQFLGGKPAKQRVRLHHRTSMTYV